MKTWTTADIPPQSGRFAIVTGATSGLGYETALALAMAGAQVVIAGRNAEKGKAAVEKIILSQFNAVKVSFELLDLSSLASVNEFAQRMLASRQSIDLLINNAGIMAPPQRQATIDGFELQLATNYLGHFALTARLMPLLEKGNAPRVVQLSSIAHRHAFIDFDDLQGEKKYWPWKAYGQSKLAMLMFGNEMNRRSEAGNWGITSNSAHPGFAVTALTANMHGIARLVTGSVVMPLLGQSAAKGALPTLYAATSPDAAGGSYYGPQGILELKGPPGPAKMSAPAQDTTAASRLWVLSEKLTGVRFA